MNAPEPMTHCPSEETLAAFVDGRLDPEARRKVVEHMTTCAECRSTVLTATEFAAQSDAPAASSGGSVSRFSPRFYFSAAAALAAAAVAIVLFGPMIRERVFPATTGIEALVEASEALPYRKVEGRLTGGFPYKPVKPTMRGPRGGGDETADLNPSELQLSAAAIAVQQQGIKNDETLHAIGISHLLVGQHDRAVAVLQDALIRCSGHEEVTTALAGCNDAALITDLSVAYMERGRYLNSETEYTNALNAAERAWRLRRTPEAAWNRALAKSALGLHTAAINAWEEFLSVSTEPEWRAAAQEEIERLRRPTDADAWFAIQTSILTSHRSLVDGANHVAQSTKHFEEVLLPEWAMVRLERRDITKLENVIRTIAHYVRNAGENLPHDGWAAVQHACNITSNCDEAAQAHMLLSKGFASFRQHRYADAIQELDGADAGLSRIQSPYALVARLQKVACILYQNDFARAGADIHRLAATVHATPYRNLNARVHWLKGLCELHAGRPEEALIEYRAAERLFERGRDSAGLSSIHTMMADALEFAGARQEAMEYRFRALSEMRASGERDRYYIAVYEAGYALAEHKQYFAADALLAEAERVAAREKQYAVAAMASILRSKVAADLNDFATTNRHARSATEFWSQIGDEHERQRVDVSALGIQEHAPESRDIAGVTYAIEFFDSRGERTWLPRLFLQRAVMRQADGDLDGAEDDLRRAIDAAEAVFVRRGEIGREDGEELNAAYSNLIDLLLREGNEFEAMLYAERARTYAGERAEADITRAATSLPESSVAVLYEIQPESVIVWLMAKDFRTYQRWELSSVALKGAVDSLRAHGPTEATLANLHDILVRPLKEKLERFGKIIIVPARGLALLPYAALLDRSTGKHLLETHIVSLAQSITQCGSSAGPKDGFDGRIAVVANPKHCDAPALPAASLEAEEIIRLRTDANVLSGSEATPERVLRELSSSSVFHFAGHATVNELAPQYSALLLSGGESDACSKRLYVHEIVTQPLSAKVVVLSACSTARTHGGARRGNATMAHAFLRAGARVVVGTLWPVRDEAGLAFSRRFHRACANGMAPIDATRQAQLELLRDRSSYKIEDWAAFVVWQRGGSQNGV